MTSGLQEKLDLSCVHSPAVAELMRCIRGQMESLITGLPPREMSAMSLGLAHRLVVHRLCYMNANTAYDYICCLKYLCRFFSAFVTTTEAAILWLIENPFINLEIWINSCSHLVAVYPATSWSSVLTRWTQWSCRLFVSVVLHSYVCCCACNMSDSSAREQSAV